MYEKELYSVTSLSPNSQNFTWLSAHTLFHLGSDKKVIFKHHFCTPGLSTVADHRAQPRGIQCTHFQRNTHVQVKIKAPFLMHLPLGFLLFLLLILHRCDSLSGIPSWISHHQQSDDYVFNPSSFIVMMTLSFPFLDFALLFSHFNTSLSTFA